MALNYLTVVLILMVAMHRGCDANFHVSHTNYGEEISHNRNRRETTQMETREDNSTTQSLQTQVFHLDNLNSSVTAVVTLVDVIPKGAIVDSFIIQRIGGEENAAKMNTKDMGQFEDARKAFERAVTQGYSAGIMGNNIDYDSGRVVTVEDTEGNQAFSAVVNISPDDQISVSISYFVYADLEGTSWQETLTSINLDDSSGDVVVNAFSPNYPDYYPNKADISWLLHKSDGFAVIHLDILSLSTEKCCDHLFIYDGSTTSDDLIAVLSGEMGSTNTYVSSGEEMLVDFVSDCTVNNGTFSMEFTISYPTVESGGNITDDTPQYEVYNVTGYEGAISSVYYPLASFPNSMYVWHVYTTNRENLITHLDVDIGVADSLVILTSSGDYITSNADTVIVVDDSFQVQYSTGQSHGSYRGFFLTFKPANVNHLQDLYDYEDHYISSPSYPYPYSANEFVAWQITAVYGDIVYLRVLDLDLVYGFSFLSIYDSQGISDNCLSKLSGNRGENLSFYTTSRYAFLVFDTDTSMVSYGFNILYRAVAGYHEYEYLEVTNTEGALSNPNYPGSTTHSDDFQYLLQMPADKVVYIRIYTCDVYSGASVTIYDGDDSENDMVIFYNGAYDFDWYPHQFLDTVSTNSTMLISFTGTWYKFMLKYIAIDSANVVNANTRTEPSGNILSPYFQREFATGITYKWQITIDAAMDMYIYTSLVEERWYSYDYLYIYSGNAENNTLLRTCYSSSSSSCYKVNSTNPEMYIEFDTHAYWYTHTLNLAYYSAAYEDMRFDSLYSSTNATYGYIISPFYPSYYSNNFDYTYHVSVPDGEILQMYFEYFSTEEESDYVTIYDGGSRQDDVIAILSGMLNSTTNFFATSNQASIQFVTNNETTSAGFKMIYRIKDYVAPEPVGPCLVYSYLNHTVVDGEYWYYIPSPGYPGNYPAEFDVCWFIDFGSCNHYDIRVYLFQMDFTYPDTLKIYKGDSTDEDDLEWDVSDSYGYYTYAYKTIYSSTITIRFKTDDYVQGKGFYIRYDRD